jgi:Mg/Co/Ni transporter MgtE
MKFSQGERETLTGPAAVGVVLGIVLAVCAVTFNSEYNAAVLSDWATIGNAMLISFGGFLLAFVPFGLVPLLVERFRFGSRNKIE